MNQNNKNLRIAIQKKGKLKEDSLKLLQKQGLEFDMENKNTLTVRCKNADIELIFVRHKDIPQYVQFGAAELGIVGENLLYENIFHIDVVKKLGFGQCSLVVAVPKDSPFTCIEDLEEERIATSYPNSLQKFLQTKNMSAAIVPIDGSVEIAPLLNLADAICDITQTGSTLKEYNLVPIATVITSQAVLIKSPFMDENKKKQLKILEKILT